MRLRMQDPLLNITRSIKMINCDEFTNVIREKTNTTKC